MDSAPPTPDSHSARDGSGMSSGGSAWTPPAVETLNAAIPSYEILGLLGRGGMGAVYKARQKALKRIVALKVMPGGLNDDTDGFAARFKNEACTLATLSHPGIVNVYDAGETEDGLLYFVMEYVEGRDLAHEIKERGRIPPGETRAIALQVAGALGYMHANGVIHRDIKPANILLTAEGRVKVADFGLAKLDETLASRLLTRTGTSMGTVEFMAPEMRRPGAVVDHRADLFSLGVMLYQMLTGELPHGVFKLPSQLLPGIDERFDTILWRLLEPIPGDRYQSAEEVCAELDLISEKNLVDAGKDKQPAPSGAKRLNTARALAIATGAAVILGVTTFVFLKKPPTTAPTSTDSPPKVALAEDEADLAATLKRLDVKWQDVSEEARSKAGALTELVVDGNAIRRRSRSGPSVRLPVTPPSWRDYAIRITHVGDAQIDLRYSAEGFYFALCQAVQTIFRKQPPGTSPGEAMMPNRLHSPRFDINQPHELVAIVQGERLRVWLDGQLVGDERDGTFENGIGAVTFVPQTELHRVEIAELTGEATWTDWLGPRLAPEAGEIGGWWDRVEGGAMTEKPISARVVSRADAIDGAVKVSYRMGDSGGLQIMARENGTGDLRQLYLAAATQTDLYLARLHPGGRTERLADVDYPAGFDRAADHILEFRCEGNRLTATLDGEFTITAEDSGVTKGIYGVALVRGTLLRSLEVSGFEDPVPDSSGK